MATTDDETFESISDRFLAANAKVDKFTLGLQLKVALDELQRDSMHEDQRIFFMSPLTINQSLVASVSSPKGNSGSSHLRSMSLATSMSC
jgi:hypothetical protein